MTDDPKRLPDKWWSGATAIAAVFLWLAAGVAGWATWAHPREFVVELLAIAAGTATLTAVLAAGREAAARDRLADREAILTQLAEYQQRIAEYHLAVHDRTLEINTTVLQMISENARAAGQLHDDAKEIIGGLDRFWSGYSSAVHDLTGGAQVLDFPNRPGA